MPNGNYNSGTGLLGDPSSTQSAIIVPKPGNPNIYYIFTVDEPHHENAATYPNQNTGASASQDDGFNNGLNYSIVDLSVTGANGSIGNITTRNTHLVTYNTSSTSELKYKCSEKITAVKNSNGSGYWVLTHFINRFYVFKIDANGVDPNPVISTISPTVPTGGYRRNSIGYLKSSPNGRKIAIAHNQIGNITGGSQENGEVLVYDFDNSTGIVSNPVSLISNSNPYGVEFSADSKKVYATTGVDNNTTSQLLQFDITSAIITPVLIHDAVVSAGALQLGPNKKIYRANSSSQGNISTYLGVINEPEVSGLGCNYQQLGVPLVYGTSTLGLPPFITSVFDTSISVVNTCLGDATEFSVPEEDINSITWDFGDGSLSNQLTPTHSYAAAGDYIVTVTLTIEGNTISNQQTVTIHPVPVATNILNAVLNQCDDDQDQIYTFNFSTLSGQILGGQDPSVFEVQYFLSNDNAVNNIDPLNNTSYRNTAPNFSVFAKVFNKNNVLCYDIISFTVNVFKAPRINSLSDFTLCDDSSDGNNTNGTTTFDLSLLNNSILGTQPASEFTISYHLNQADADLDLNPQSLSFTNTIPDSQPLVVRIENNANRSCYTTRQFNVVVNRLPIANAAQLTQCDFELNPDGFTTFNLEEAIPSITGNATGVTTKFYFDPTHAANDSFALNTTYRNTQNPQVIHVRVTNNLTGCYRLTTLTLNVTVNPTITVPLRKCDVILSEDGFTEFDLTQTGFATGGNTVTYYAESDDALLEENPLSTDYTNTVADHQRIYARIENGNDCVGINIVDLYVDALPDIVTTDSAIFCLNRSADPVTLDAGIGNQNPGLFNYLWTPNGETTSTIDVFASGTYTVTVTNAARCSKLRTIIVTDSDVAVVESVSVIDLSDNNTITVYVEGDESEFLYSLDLPDGPFQESNYFDDVTPGIHHVYIKDKEECGSVRKEVSVLAIPSFFTPNGDGYNDTWRITGMENGHYDNSTIHIYDRFGKLVKQMAPSGEGWNGVYNNQLLPATDYWYVIYLQDGRTIKGHFALKR